MDAINIRYKCLWFSVPFHFTDSGIDNASVVSQGILEYGIACVVEEGTVRVHEEWYEKTMLLALDEGDTMTPTERKLMADVGDEGEPEWAGGSFNEKIKKSQETFPRQFNFVFIWSWIPGLQIYLLAKHVQRTFDEDEQENQMFNLSLVYWFFTIFVPIPSKQQTKHVMTLSVCKNVRILIFGATGSAANVLRAPGSTVK